MIKNNIYSKLLLLVSGLLVSNTIVYGMDMPDVNGIDFYGFMPHPYEDALSGPCEYGMDYLRDDIGRVLEPLLPDGSELVDCPDDSELVSCPDGSELVGCPNDSELVYPDGIPNSLNVDILDKHLDEHLDEQKSKPKKAASKKVMCPYCGKGFGGQGAFKIHELIHTGEKPFACELCDRRFAQKGNLKKHMGTHTGKKPFACKLCPKAYSVKISLKRHMLCHANEEGVSLEDLNIDFLNKKQKKPFECTRCTKKFKWQSILTEHMRAHTGERPFVCAICGSGYVAKNNLNTHMKKRHPTQELL